MVQLRFLLSPVQFLRVYSEELDFGMTLSSKEELESSKPKSRIDKLLREHAISTSSPSQQQEQQQASFIQRMVQLRFLLSPVQFLPHPQDKTRIGSVICQRTVLQGPAGKQVATGKENDFIEIPADLVLVSIGYRGTALWGMDESMFDLKRGILKNQKGRIGAGGDKEHESSQMARLYSVGWIKRGPTGIIGTNIPDAKETVQSILEDLDQYEEISRRTVRGRQGLDELLKERSIQFVDFQDYLLIDQKEKDPKRIRSALQPREKITSLEEMLSAISNVRGGL
jgi:adrenodoxin-NADP+ reductase